MAASQKRKKLDLVEQRVHPADGDAVVLVARRGVVNHVVLGRQDQARPLEHPHPRAPGSSSCAHLWNWLVQNMKNDVNAIDHGRVEERSPSRRA